MSSVDHRSHKGLNNRAENSHQPTRQRERAMKGFPTVAEPRGSCPRSARSHRTSGPTATGYRTEMRHRFGTWNEITGTTAMPTEA